MLAKDNWWWNFDDGGLYTPVLQVACAGVYNVYWRCKTKDESLLEVNDNPSLSYKHTINNLGISSLLSFGCKEDIRKEMKTWKVMEVWAWSCWWKIPSLLFLWCLHNQVVRRALFLWMWFLCRNPCFNWLLYERSWSLALPLAVFFFWRTHLLSPIG